MMKQSMPPHETWKFRFFFSPAVLMSSIIEDALLYDKPQKDSIAIERLPHKLYSSILLFVEASGTSSAKLGKADSLS